MIPARYAHFVFGFILSGMMSMMVSGITTFRSVGVIDGFVVLWFSNWLPSWSIAYPTLLIMTPFVRRFVAQFTRVEAERL